MATFEFGEEFYPPLGRFIRNFTFLEYWLYRELLYVADITPGIGKALFSGTRADTLTTLIRRCYEAKGLQLEPLIERILQHTSLLNAARNDAVHSRYVFGLDEVTMDNKHRTLAGRAKESKLSIELLDDMSADAWQGGSALMARARERERPGLTKPETLASFDEPWRYKPPSPASPRRARPSRAQKRERPRRASPE